MKSDGKQNLCMIVLQGPLTMLSRHHRLDVKFVFLFRSHCAKMHADKVEKKVNITCTNICISMKARFPTTFENICVCVCVC